ncbi:hypothetical protein GJ496_006257 [Pomphorhynchus laevis]|nr:hypothetical protein GJ496_006257 [Pomphorhynchus laevis]
MHQEDLPYIEVDPPDIRFTGPYDGNTVSSTLNIKNNSSHAIVFKVKTTAPKRYCVRPKSDIIDAFSSKEITISLQSFNLSTEDVTKHKFMIQAAFQSDNDHDHSQFWNDPSKKYASMRLRCVFENFIAESNGRPPGDSNISLPTVQDNQNEFASSTMNETDDESQNNGIPKPLLVSYNDDFSSEFHSVIAKNKNTFDTQSSGYIDTVNNAKSQYKLDDDQPITTNIELLRERNTKNIRPENVDTLSVTVGNPIIHKLDNDKYAELSSAENRADLNYLLIICMIAVSFTAGLGLYKILAALNIMN